MLRAPENDSKGQSASSDHYVSVFTVTQSCNIGEAAREAQNIYIFNHFFISLGTDATADGSKSQLAQGF